MHRVPNRRRIGARPPDTIRILRAPAVPDQIEEMQQALSTYIKVVVDIERGILAGGGVMHADYEAALLADGSVQENI